MRTASTRSLKQTLIAFCSLLLFAGCSLFGSDDADDKGGDDTPAASVRPGVYEMRDTVELTEEDFGVEGTATLHGYLQLRADSTYLLQGYMTSEDLDAEGVLVLEERGRFRHVDSLLRKTSITIRVSDPTQPGVAAWEDEANEQTPIRAVTETSFETWDEDENEWTAWRRVSGAADLATDDDVAFLDPVAGYGLTLPSDWTLSANMVADGQLYDLRALAPTVNGITPNLLAYTVDATPGQTLEARMNAEANALDAGANITVTRRAMIQRGGATVGEIVFTNVTSSNTLKQKVWMFAGAEGKLVLHVYTDLASQYDQNAGFQAVEASIRFFGP